MIAEQAVAPGQFEIEDTCQLLAGQILYEQMPDHLPLSSKLRKDLQTFWLTSWMSGNEWVGAVTRDRKLQPKWSTLGFQDESSVTIPVTSLETLIASGIEDIDRESSQYLGESNYQGKMLYLTRPHHKSFVDYCQATTETDRHIFLPQTDFFGVGHTHLDRRLLDLLPSFTDFWVFMVARAFLLSTIAIINHGKVSVAIKSAQTARYHIPRETLLSAITSDNIADSVRCESCSSEDLVHEEIIGDHCQCYNIALYQGLLSEPVLARKF